MENEVAVMVVGRYGHCQVVFRSVIGCWWPLWSSVSVVGGCCEVWPVACGRYCPGRFDGFFREI